MLLKKLDVTNIRGDVLNLFLENPAGEIFIKSIEGLGPVKSVMSSSSFANLDGETYYTSRRETRNIVLKLGLDPNYSTGSIHELRSQLYNFFMPKTEAFLNFNLYDKFTNTVLDLEITGRIESCEPSLFTKDPTVDISIICYDPNFVDPTVIELDGNTIGPRPITPGYEDVGENYVYEGLIETGVLFTLYPNKNIADFTIYYRGSDNIQHSALITYDFVDEDIVKVNSVPGSKYIKLIRDEVETSILYALDSIEDNWLELIPGNNVISVQVDDSETLASPFTIEYTRKYGGL